MSDVRRTRVEDYLGAVEQICEERGLERASTGSVAELLGVAKGTASSTLQQLANDGLVDHLAYEGVCLTDQGRQRARLVLRRRRLLELFLSKTLGAAWENVTDEAWRLEPAASEQLIELVDTFLNRPSFDPHGDPIPKANGTLPESNAIPLSTCEVGVRVILRRVTDQSDSVLRFLREAGLELGVELVVRENASVSGTIEFDVAGSTKTIGYIMADQLLVEQIID